MPLSGVATTPRLPMYPATSLRPSLRMSCAVRLNHNRCPADINVRVSPMTGHMSPCGSMYPATSLRPSTSRIDPASPWLHVPGYKPSAINVLHRPGSMYQIRSLRWYLRGVGVYRDLPWNMSRIHCEEVFGWIKRWRVPRTAL